MNAPLISFAILSEIIWLITLAFSPWRLQMGVFLSLFGAVFLVYLLGVRLVLRKNVSAQAALFIMGAGILFRITIFFSPPTLSDDIYRYLWDGRVQLAGINPYTYPPDSPDLMALRTPNWEGINHKSIRTIYPPASQALFAFGTFVRPTVPILKIIFIGFDVLTSVLIFLFLKKRNLPLGRVLIYSWHPLAIVEFASSGHMDSFAIAAMMAGFLLLERNHSVKAGMAWGVGFLAKLATGLLIPWMILSQRGRRSLFPFLALIIFGYAIYALYPMGEWRNFLSSPILYASTWSFNAGLFELFTKIPFFSASLWRLSSGALIAGFACWLALKNRVSPFAQLGLLLALVLFLSPVVYPWYAVWLIPFLCFYPLKAGLVFTSLVTLSYLVLPRFDGGLGWTLPPWVLVVEYGLPSIFLAWEFKKRKIK